MLDWFAELWGKGDDAEGMTRVFLGKRDFWGRDLNELPGLNQAVSAHLNELLQHGPSAVLQKLE